MFCTRILAFARRITPVASDTEISSTSPFGSMPSSAAADDTTASYVPECRRNIASTNSSTPSGMIRKLVNRMTLRIESSSSECTRFSWRTSLISEFV